jgi:hypothetical protein
MRKFGFAGSTGRRRIALTAAFAFMAGGLPGSALAIEGQYSVEGQNPGQERAYKGEAQIKRTGRTYSVIWRVGQVPQFGTGILIDKTFSIVFQTFTQAGGPGRPGIAVFSVENDRISQGIWTGIGQQDTGIETWTATDRP